ncbi:uncharacterized protein LOC114325747 [Diabrotica virgifera virgifera]|uniref:Uncharacterized protein LOC114325747 n=1 Tax=Diabrotica virgifera virgifera TaxID=50390 RepID=A0A6P7F230_DIAVI|nr:uncharacterized protein LOC114325747 [Diabrotica virgifera virgifera]
MFFHISKTFCWSIVLISLISQSREDDYEYCPVFNGYSLVYNNKVNGTYIKLRIPESNFFEKLINCIQIMDLKDGSCKPTITHGGFGYKYMELILEGASEVLEYEIQVYTYL